jgi:hypothetical protein
MPTTRRSTRTDRHPCDQLSRPAARVHADGTAVPFPGPAGRGASPGEAQPTLVPRDASCTDGRTTDTPRDDDTPAAGAESAKPQVSGGVGGARGGFEPPTCRLRGHRSPTSMSTAGRIAQLRMVERKGQNDPVKGGTLAETLAEQSKPSGTPRQSRPPDLGSGGVLGAPAPAGALLLGKTWEESNLSG